MRIDNDPLVDGRVVGDVWDLFRRYIPLRVTYNNNREVTNGCELKHSQVVNLPRVDIGCMRSTCSCSPLSSMAFE